MSNWKKLFNVVVIVMAGMIGFLLLLNIMYELKVPDFLAGMISALYLCRYFSWAAKKI